MAQMLDFTKTNKPTLPIKLPDKSMVYVYTPSKAGLDELVEAKDKLEDIIDDDREALTQLYDLAARLMNNNKTGREFTGAELEKMFDTGDLVLFFAAYSAFIGEIYEAKN